MPKALAPPQTPWKVDKGEPGDAVAKPVRFTQPSSRYLNKGAKPPAQIQHQHHTSTLKRQATTNDQCFNCSKTGHFSSNCPFPRKPKKDYVHAAHSTMNGEEEGDADDEYRVSEPEEEHEGDKESVTPHSEQEYTEIEVAASEFYEDDHDSILSANRVTAMTVVPSKEVITTSDDPPTYPDTIRVYA